MDNKVKAVKPNGKTGTIKKIIKGIFAAIGIVVSAPVIIITVMIVVASGIEAFSEWQGKRKSRTGVLFRDEGN